MLILGIDTSGRQGSIALAEGGSGQFRLLDIARLDGGDYSAQLIPQLVTLLARHQISKGALEALGVVSGPGSFTGLRVGLSTAKALAEATGNPIAVVSRLEALAWAAGREGSVIAALDAGRGQIFLGEYQFGRGGTLRIREWLVTTEELIGLRRENAGILLVTSDEMLDKHLRVQGLPALLIPAPQADVVAKLGLGKILAGDTVAADVLDANYIRRPDAELSYPIAKISP